MVVADHNFRGQENIMIFTAWGEGGICSFKATQLQKENDV